MKSLFGQTREAKPSAILRRLEALLVGAGLLLLAFSAGAFLLGRFQKNRDLLRFQEALAAPAPATLAEPANVDTSRWDAERRKAWEESRRTTRLPLAILRVPKIRLEVPVLEGTDELTLNRGAGLIPDTARPGEPGNVGIAAHRDGFFRGLMDVSPGDALELETLQGRTSYTVESIRIVEPDDVSVLEPTPGPAVTLVTCYPFYFVGSAPQRFIVRAVASPRRTAAAGAGRQEDNAARNP